LDISRFTAGKTGQIVAIPGDPPADRAFVPDPLPPKWEWNQELWPLLMEAHKALARLDGTGKHLPSPEILLRPLQNREAQRSSSLEGTYTEPEEQLLFQIDPRYPTSSEDPVNAYREVFNYAKALRLRKESRDKLPLSLRLIRRLHEVLLEGVRGADTSPGEFRKLQVHIGRPPRFIPPPPDLVPELLDTFEKHLHRAQTYDPLVGAFLVHYQFEAIHPFRDGNGRVGRLLLAVMIAEWCGLSDQWLYMSAYFDKNKDTYTDTLFDISAKGDWEGWIRFCLEGVTFQAEDTEHRCEQLVELNRTFREKVADIGGSYRLSSIIDDLFEFPMVQVPSLAQKFNVTYPTANADVLKLVKAGILEQVERRENATKTFCASQILETTFRE
jgi:cell filamentation protein, protein adenylyltransferase